MFPGNCTIHSVLPNDATLLSAPLTSAATNNLLTLKSEALCRLTARLNLLHVHDALYLLCNCFAISQLLYVLRTSPSWRSQRDLVAFDKIVRESLQSNATLGWRTLFGLKLTSPCIKGV